MTVPDDIPQQSKDCLENRACGGCGTAGYILCPVFLAGRQEHLRRKLDKLRLSMADPSSLTPDQRAYKTQEGIDIPAALGLVDGALKGSGRYGICRTCSQPIPKARLEHFPEAVRCAACQERADKITVPA